MKQLSFKSKGLAVDWISINLKGLTDIKHITKIASYLSNKYHFNSKIEHGYSNRFENLVYNETYSFSAIFIHFDLTSESRPHWIGTILNFSARNAAYLYKLIKTQQFDWQIFDPYSMTIGRFDICYAKEHTSEHSQEKLELFLQNCQQAIRSRSPRRVNTYTNGNKGLKLTIGSRQSPNFYRIYLTTTTVRFELEIKKKFIQRIQNHLFNYDTEQFENIITIHFYKHSQKILQYDDLYTPWLIDHIRRKKTNINSNSFFIPYLQNGHFETDEEQVNFFRLLQFLSFSHDKIKICYTRQILTQKYYIAEFKLIEFMQFANIPTHQYYQVNKIKEYFIQLHSTKIFAEDYFTFPFVEVKKEGSYWMIRIPLREQIYLYNYPFSLTKYFLNYDNKYQLKVRIKILQAFCTPLLKKQFSVFAFLNNFKTIPHQQKAKIKRIISRDFKELEKKGFIRPVYTIYFKSGVIQDIEELTNTFLGKAQRIDFYELL